MQLKLLGGLLGAIMLVSQVQAVQISTLDAAALKQYDGKDGHKAYVALNGYVYDVSQVKAWQGGHHYKGMVAGTDLTPYISSSPHGAEVINKLKLQPVAVYKN